MLVKWVKVAKRSWRSSFPLPLMSYELWIFVKVNPDRKNISQKFYRKKHKIYKVSQQSIYNFRYSKDFALKFSQHTYERWKFKFTKLQLKNVNFSKITSPFKRVKRKFERIFQRHPFSSKEEISFTFTF